jgi:hypothetical protein
LWFLYWCPFWSHESWGFKRSPPAAPYTGGRHGYNGLLPGVPRGLFTTLANSHPSATQPSARGLTPLLRCVPSLVSRTKSARSGEGVSQMISGSAILSHHEVVTRKTCMKKSSLWVAQMFPHSHPSIWIGQTVLEH